MRADRRHVFMAGHVSPIYGPVQALEAYLRRRAGRFTFVSLPFSYAGMAGALCRRHEDGELTGSRRGHACRGPEPWLWVKDFLFVLASGLRGERAGLFIGIDNLNAAAGILLRALGKADRVAYYVIDYTPQRFRNRLLNGLYHAVDRFCVRHADVVWNLSSRMREVRQAQGLAPERNQVVPVGVELREVKPAAPARVRRSHLLYMGALQENKGIQLLIEAMPGILKKAPGARLDIIGYGPFEADLKALAAASPAAKAIRFPGPMGHAELMKKVPEYGMALAPYLEEAGSYSYWCDPTKPKEYLACGVPLVITRVPWLWELVADPRKPMGVAVGSRKEELAAACLKLMQDHRFYWACRRNARAFSRGLDWKNIYDRAFAGVPL